MKEEDSEIGEEKDSSRSEPTSTSKAKMSQQGSDASVPDCAVCLQTCVHPVELPCSHVFCFLCVKGASTQYRRCALCRQEIPVDFFTSPKLLLVHEGEVDEEDDEEVEEHYTWFYEGRNGWWQYDERTSIELEESYRTNKRTFELLIAGYVYVIDLDSMLQYRRADPSRRRRIKRDLVNAPKKGIAGLKIKVKREEESADREVDGAEEEKENAGAVGGTLTTQMVGNKNKASKKKTNFDKRSSQVVDDNEGDDGVRNERTPTSYADRGDAASGESVYEVLLTGALPSSSLSSSSRTSTEHTTFQTRSTNADEPAFYTVPVRQRRKPSDSPAASNSQGASDSQSIPATALSDQNPSQNVTASSTVAGSLPIYHQRTHSAPEVRPLPRPRGNPPIAPPRSHSSVQNIRHSSGRPEECLSSTSNQSARYSSGTPEEGSSSPSNQNTRPSSTGLEEGTAASVEDLTERVRSELVINIERRSSGARRRHTHHQVHEV